MKSLSLSHAEYPSALERRSFLRLSTKVVVATAALICSRSNRLVAHEVLTPVCRCESGQQSIVTMPSSINHVINWDDGRRIRLSSGDTATCSTLEQGQIYCLFLYNSSKSDQNVEATLVWSNSQPPVVVTVSGTKDNQGPASLVLVSGDDTTTISASITETGDGSLECYMGSVDMPLNTVGLHNFDLPPDGQSFPLLKGYRYHAVPDNSWYQLTVENKYNQSSIVQFRLKKIIIYIVNPAVDAHAIVTPLGSIKEGEGYEVKMPEKGEVPQRISEQLQGDGSQWVWMSADSEENARSAAITLQAINSASGADDKHG